MVVPDALVDLTLNDSHSVELQTTDMELAVCTGPGTRNLGIPHVSTPSLRGGVRKNCEVRLKRVDRDS